MARDTQRRTRYAYTALRWDELAEARARLAAPGEFCERLEERLRNLADEDLAETIRRESADAQRLARDELKGGGAG